VFKQNAFLIAIRSKFRFLTKSKMLQLTNRLIYLKAKIKSPIKKSDIIHQIIIFAPQIYKHE